MLALIYDLADDYLEQRGSFRAEHLDLAREANQRGDLHLAGAFSEPYDRALFVWATDDDEIVRRFVDADPYVSNGLVTAWQIRRWNVVVGGDDGSP